MAKIGGYEIPDEMIVSNRPASVGAAARLAAGSERSDLEAAFLFACRAFGLPEPAQQVLFADRGRKWRLDFAWLEARVAVEVDGGIWGTGPECECCGRRQPGRHLTGTGFLEDCEKAMTATRLGWALIKFPQPWVSPDVDPDRFEELAAFIAGREPQEVP